MSAAASRRGGRNGDLSAENAAPARFSAWRLIVWLVLLLSAFGILQYVRGVWRLLPHLHDSASQAAGHASLAWALAWALAWTVVYLLVACLTLTAATGALLRREWARRLLRVLAVLLAVWALFTGVNLLLHWSEFQRSSHALAALPGLDDSSRVLLARVRRSFMVGIALKLIAVPLLAWLAWRLGRPCVRAQFRAPR